VQDFLRLFLAFRDRLYYPSSVESEKYPYDFINVDEIAREISPYNLENARLKAGKRFFKKLDDFIEGSKNFLLESTLSGKNMGRLIPRLKENGYFVKIIYIFLETPEVCIERIKRESFKRGTLCPREGCHS